jgi:phosphate transport system substrate-binding protein
MKKTLIIALALVLSLGMALQAAADDAITVVSREDGSGTRGAFIELFGVEVKNADGDKEDMTTEDAEITNSTSVAMTSVAGNPGAIGYISLGSLDDTVKALKSTAWRPPRRPSSTAPTRSPGPSTSCSPKRRVTRRRLSSSTS